MGLEVSKNTENKSRERLQNLKSITTSLSLAIRKSIFFRENFHRLLGADILDDCELPGLERTQQCQTWTAVIGQ